MDSIPVPRKNVRYRADPAHYAQLDFSTEPGSFRAELVALIFDESYKGCCLIAVEHDKLVVGARCRIQLGPLEPLWGELKWIRVVDHGLLRVGFHFP